ncbi:MAG: hypothetical protein LBT22_07920, partial [Peptococcaceae bacterium]|nr:hypothetical protein [Peptococcaceae bacterium]
MFIECVKNNGTDYLRVTEVFRDESGEVPKCRRRVLRNVGPLSRFDDGKPEYLKRLRESFRIGSPIIESLSELYGAKPARRTVRFECDLENAADC